MQILAIVS